jgi:hypothetical protein
VEVLAVLKLLADIGGGIEAAQKIVQAAKDLGSTHLGDNDRKAVLAVLHPSVAATLTSAFDAAHDDSVNGG